MYHSNFFYISIQCRSISSWRILLSITMTASLLGFNKLWTFFPSFQTIAVISSNPGYPFISTKHPSDSFQHYFFNCSCSFRSSQTHVCVDGWLCWECWPSAANYSAQLFGRPTWQGSCGLWGWFEAKTKASVAATHGLQTDNALQLHAFLEANHSEVTSEQHERLHEVRGLFFFNFTLGNCSYNNFGFHQTDHSSQVSLPKRSFFRCTAKRSVRYSRNLHSLLIWCGTYWWACWAPFYFPALDILSLF